jgi:hypothetical protein
MFFVNDLSYVAMGVLHRCILDLYLLKYISSGLCLHNSVFCIQHRSYLGWLIIYCFTSRSRIFHLYGDVTIIGEALQNLGLWSTLRALEQGGIFIVPQLLWHGASVFPVSSEGPPDSIASSDILCGDVTIIGEALQNLGLCSTLRALKQGGIFIVPQLLWHRTSVFPVSSEGPSDSIASSDILWDVEDLF